MPGMTRRARILVALPLAALAAGAARQGFDETTSVVAVEVPVTVVKGDEPVRGLSAADFELYRLLTPTYVHVFCSVSHSHLL